MRTLIYSKVSHRNPRWPWSVHKWPTEIPLALICSKVSHSNSVHLWPTEMALGLICSCPLRKHAYSNILKILQPEKENFQIKTKSDIFYISAQNRDCGYSLEPHHRAGSNEYPQSMFLSRNEKNNVYPCKPVYLYKSGVKGVKII